MAKKNTEKAERRAQVERLRQQQARAERRRSMLILGVCVVAVVGLLAAALIPYIKDQREKDRIAGVDIDELGVSADAAGCDPIKTEDASGSGQHKAIGTKITYDHAPPAYGPHWGNFLQGAEIRNFYTVDDRPELERVVHSLEHGHTLVWYDETVKPGTTAYDDLEQIASKFSAPDYYMTVPWLKTDGPDFPEGKHIALTHWTGPEDQKGVWQYCAAPSGEVIGDFTEKYQPLNAPEPGAA